MLRARHIRIKAGVIACCLSPAGLRFEAELIADVVRLDARYYDAGISEGAVTIMNQFLQDTGRLDHAVSYEQVVATQMRPLWHRSNVLL